MPWLTHPRLALIKSIRRRRRHSNHQLSISNPAANLAAKNSPRNSAKITKLKLRRERENFSSGFYGGQKLGAACRAFSLLFGGTNYAWSRASFFTKNNTFACIPYHISPISTGQHDEAPLRDDILLVWSFIYVLTKILFFISSLFFWVKNDWNQLRCLSLDKEISSYFF